MNAEQRKQAAKKLTASVQHVVALAEVVSRDVNAALCEFGEFREAIARLLLKDARARLADAQNEINIMEDSIKGEIKPNCLHRYEVSSPIDTIEVCVKCGDRQNCEPLINQWPK